MSHALHERPEVAFEETFAVATLTEALARHGIDARTGVYGLPTAFEATIGSGEGSRVGAYGLARTALDFLWDAALREAVAREFADAGGPVDVPHHFDASPERGPVMTAPR